MERALEALKFHFRNGDTWTVHHQDISDLWIGRVTTSYGRIKGGHMTIIHPCKSFKAEFKPDADAIDPDTTQLSSVTSGMFERVTHYQDIEKLISCLATNVVVNKFTCHSSHGMRMVSTTFIRRAH